MVKFNNSWDEILKNEFSSPYYLKIRRFLKQQYMQSGKTIYPPMTEIFSAFKFTDYNSIKAVILGQDPYHGENQANGLAFSVPEGQAIPPSLVNIFKEMEDDLGGEAPADGDLSYLAKQGVLLLNASLTVEKGRANSHSDCGWLQFTDNVIRLISGRKTPAVFLLWGRNAVNKRCLIDENIHYVLTAAHPSPLSAYKGFFGCKHFSRTNAILQSHNIAPIQWLR